MFVFDSETGGGGGGEKKGGKKKSRSAIIPFAGDDIVARRDKREEGKEKKANSSIRERLVRSPGRANALPPTGEEGGEKKVPPEALPFGDNEWPPGG